MMSHDPNDDDALEPMKRDSAFLYRLVALLVIGAAIAAFVGLKIKSAAANCGAGMLRPGGSVIPPESH